MTTMSKLAVSAVITAALGCGGGGEPGADAAPPVETLVPEPAGAPTATADGRLSCLGRNEPDPPSGNAIELTGYVRVLDDPTAAAEPPQATVTAFSEGGAELGTAFSDATKSGRVAVTVPVSQDGFTGYVVASMEGLLDARFFSSLPITTTEISGWAWLATQAEVDALAAELGVTLEPGKAIVIGAVHDCDTFGVANAVVQINGSTDGIYYVSGFSPAAGDTFTTASGRFVAPNVDPGQVVIKAFGRLEAAGPLTLLSSIRIDAAAQGVMQVDLQPRAGSQ